MSGASRRISMPAQTRTLLETHRLRMLVKPYGVAKMDASESQISIQFGQNAPIDPVKVIMLIPEKTETAQTTSQTALKERLLTIAKRCASLPLLDRRTPDEILGYDDYGMPSA